MLPSDLARSIAANSNCCIWDVLLAAISALFFSLPGVCLCQMVVHRPFAPTHRAGFGYTRSGFCRFWTYFCVFHYCTTMEPDPKRKVCSAMSMGPYGDMGPKAQTMLTLSKRWGSGATHQDLTLHWSLGKALTSMGFHGSSQRLPLQFGSIFLSCFQGTHGRKP